MAMGFEVGQRDLIVGVLPMDAQESATNRDRGEEAGFWMRQVVN